MSSVKTLINLLIWADLAIQLIAVAYILVQNFIEIYSCQLGGLLLLVLLNPVIPHMQNARSCSVHNKSARKSARERMCIC